MITQLLIAGSMTISLLYFSKIVLVRTDRTLADRITLVDAPSVEGNPLKRLIKVSFKKRNIKRFRSALFELGDLLDLFSVALSSGEGVLNSLAFVNQRAQGIVAEEFRRVLRGVELGERLEDELRALSERLPQQQVVEMCNKFILALNRGTPLAEMLRSQAETVRSEIRNQITKQAGKNETRMLIPLVFLILPVTVLFAIYPSVQMLGFQTI